MHSFFAIGVTPQAACLDRVLGLYHDASPSKGFRDDDGGLFVNNGQSRHQARYSEGPFGPADNICCDVIYHTSVYGTISQWRAAG